MSHTPTPWKVAGEHGSYLASVEGGFVPLRTPFRKDAFEGPDRSYHSDEELQANAELIVKAVNSYQAMKEALEGLMNTLKALDEDYDVRHSYVQAEKALTLTNTKGRKS